MHRTSTHELLIQDEQHLTTHQMATSAYVNEWSNKHMMKLRECSNIFKYKKMSNLTCSLLFLATATTCLSTAMHADVCVSDKRCYVSSSLSSLSTQISHARASVGQMRADEKPNVDVRAVRRLRRRLAVGVSTVAA